MKLLDKIFKKDKPVMDKNIIVEPLESLLQIPEFIDVSFIKWIFNYEDENTKIYVYKITYPNMPFLYARIQMSPSKQYSIRLFSYTGDKELNKDNLFKVKIGKYQLNYCISQMEMKTFGPDNKFGFSYNLLWDKIIDEYWKYVDEN